MKELYDTMKRYAVYTVAATTFAMGPMAYAGNGGNFAGGNYTPEPKSEQTETVKKAQKNDSEKKESFVKEHPILTAIITGLIVGGIAALANGSDSGSSSGTGGDR